jgi:hypothetical protein
MGGQVDSHVSGAKVPDNVFFIKQGIGLSWKIKGRSEHSHVGKWRDDNQ